MPTPWDEPEEVEPADTTCGWACRMEEERKRKQTPWPHDDEDYEPKEEYPWN